MIGIKKYSAFYQTYQLFFYLFFSITAVGLYVDAKPLFEKLYEAREQEKVFLVQLAEKEKALQAMGPVSTKLLDSRRQKTKGPILDQLLRAAALSHCQLRELEAALKAEPAVANKTTVNQFIIKLQLEGSFASFFHFIVLLRQEALPLRIDHFFLKMENKGLVLSLQLTAFPRAFWLATRVAPLPEASLLCCTRDPFQESLLTKGVLTGLLQDPLLQVSIKELRYVGYIAQAGQSSALVLLPNAKVYELYLGSLISKAHWRVAMIADRAIILLDPAQKNKMQIPRE